MQIQRKTHEYDASQIPLGRLASLVATLLSGKRKVGYRPNVDSGDFVVVKNCRLVLLTGNKAAQKVYYRFSGYPGGMKRIPLERQRAKNPTRIVYQAIYHMLPDNRLRKGRMRRLTLKA